MKVSNEQKERNQGYESENSVIYTGFSDLDRLTGGMKAGELVLLGGRPGMGKTSFAGNIALYNAVNEQKNVLYVTFERTRESMVSYLLSILSETAAFKCRSGELSEAEMSRLFDASEQLAKANLCITDTFDSSVDIMQRALDYMKKGAKYDFIIIDYLQLFVGNYDRDERFKRAKQNIKDWAELTNIPILVLVQLSKALESEKNKRPTLFDVNDTYKMDDSLFDQVWLLHRDGDDIGEYHKEHTAEVIVAKNPAKTGTVSLWFHPEFVRFRSQ